MEKLNELCVGVSVENREKNEISIPLEEYAKLKDIQTRFEILKNEFIHASYCPIHHQIILGIEDAYAKKTQELKNGSIAGELEEAGGRMMRKYKKVVQCNECKKIYPNGLPYFCYKCGAEIARDSMFLGLVLTNNARHVAARRRLFKGWEIKQ